MNIKRALLINPPFDRLKGKPFHYFPMGLGYLAAESERNGFFTRIYNVESGSPADASVGSQEGDAVYSHKRYMEGLRNPSHHVWKEAEKTIADFKPDIVGISVMTPKYGPALKLSQICKAVNPDIRVVWGGPHPTLLPDQCLENDCVDIAVRGEGEATWLGLCRDPDGNLEAIDGISFKRNGRIIHNKPRALLTDLDALPFMGRGLVLNHESYGADAFAVISSSRGCPFQCAYCCAPVIWGRKIRHRSVEKVAAEIAYVQSHYHTDTFMFWDDNFSADRSYAMALCERIVADGLRIRFNCYNRVNTVDDELLDRMRKAGCYNMDFGIETGSRRMLEVIQKGITHEQIERAIRLCRKHNINWNSFFMIGFPQETRQDVLDSLEYVRKIRPPNGTVCVFTPYPGTEMFRVAQSYGLIDKNMDWSEYSHQGASNKFVKNMTKKELDELFAEFEAELKRLRDSFWSKYYTRKALLPYYLSHIGFCMSQLFGVKRTRKPS